MQLPSRTYYYKPRKKPSEQALIDRIEQICLDFPKYGYRRVTKQLHREGLRINDKNVHRIMREKASCVGPERKNGFAPPTATTICPFIPTPLKI